MKRAIPLPSPRYRPITHLVFAGWLAILALVAASIWRRALQSGVLDVRGPALHRAHEPAFYWLAMGGAAVVIFMVAATALLAMRAFWQNVTRGRTSS